ncbi:50S ribosomal protein L5 [Candidatus Peregrinibacteria bacterium]|nr:MAG: 50S ribosomal protein L5 [Candidatus Peregrinibacteria bacterium]
MSFKSNYKTKILPALQKELGKKSLYNVPHLEKVIVNIGIGSYVLTKDKDYQPIFDRVEAITGQKPVLIEARKAISNFKLRAGMPNGIRVTLRGDRMFAFLERLIHVALPRTRDFRGVSKRAFDGNGNYSMGITEMSIFPEVRIDDMGKMHGLQVNIVTSTNSDADAFSLLEKIGVPFRK